MNNYYQYSEKLIGHALKLNGTCTGEHGIGLGKRKYLLNQFGTETLEMMKSLKKTLDPNNILNPNKIFI
jgi:D-lactate dehydrogenase (cytochrome)